MTEDWDALAKGHALVDLLECVCEHHVEDHEPVGTGAGRCLVDGCGCSLFEADEEGTAERNGL